MTDTFGDISIRFVTPPIRAQTSEPIASPVLSFPLGILVAPLLYDSPTANYQVGQYPIDSLPPAIVVFGFGLISLFLILNAVAGFGGLDTERLLRPIREGANL